MKAVSILCVVVLALTTAAWPQAGINVSQVTHNGKANSGVALSPDGKLLAYILQEDITHGGYSLWVHNISGGADRQLTTARMEIQLPVFSPDAESLWYLAAVRPGLNNLQRWNIAGESAGSKQAAADVDTAVSFAPDGKSLAFIRWVPGGTARLILLPVGTRPGKPQELWTFKRNPAAVAWSPDGTEIAVPVRESDLSNVRFISVKKGTTREILAPGIVRALVWTKTALFATMRKADQPSAFQVWTCTLPGGGPGGTWRQITHDAGGYVGSSLSASADGSLVAAARLVKFQTGLEDLAAWVGNTDGGPRINPDVVLIRP